MADISSIYDLLSGKSKGLFPSIMRTGLRILEPIYTVGARLKNQRYDRRPDLAQKVGAKVISVGNLTTGGTGKTPVIAMLAQWLLNDGVKVGIVSRGYKSPKGELNDEGKELKLILPTVPHVQHRNRVLAANELIDQHKVEVILVDDGFQHRRLFRDVDIVLIDATNPFGFGHLLPRGLLREPVTSLARANIALITRASQVETGSNDSTINLIRQHNPDIQIAQSNQKPTHLVNKYGGQLDLSSLNDRAVVGFCGIGNPNAFKMTLENLGCILSHFKIFPDHHIYSNSEIDSLNVIREKVGASYLVCTMKDLVKLKDLMNQTDDLFALRVETEITQGRHIFETMIGK